MSLSPEHRDKLRQSALTDQQIDALGWSSLHTGRLQIPYLRPDGTPETGHDGKPFIRERLSQAEINANPKGGKYRSPKGQGCRLFHSPLAIAAGNYEQRLRDRFTPLRITEGEAKTAAANVHDSARLTIGLGGVSSWRDRYDGQGPDDESRPLTDWDDIPLQGREVRLCFDSDLRKPQVAAELQKLARFLQERGAHVLIEVLPHGLDGKRLGLDDLIHRHGAEVFHKIAAIARSPFKTTRNGISWALNPEPQNTHGRAVYVVGMVGPNWRADPLASDRWLRWTGTHWEEVVGNDAVTEALHHFLDMQGWENRELRTIRSLQAYFRATVGALPPVPMEGLIPLRNGCLRLSDRALVEHDREHGNRSSLPYDWNPRASAEPIVQFLRDTLGSETDVQIVRAFARAIVQGERLKPFLEITGSGDTGKSVVGNLLIALAGERNTASMDLGKLEAESSRFETRKLAGRRLAIFNESHRYHGPLETLKALTGGDRIRAELKGSNADCDFTFGGVAVLIGNGLVQPSDASSAVLNRRRAVFADRIVKPADQRPMLERTASGWSGELAPFLSGFMAWVLAMPDADARTVLARDHCSVERIDNAYRALLETDPLLAWADDYLVWDPKAVGALAARIGASTDEPENFLFPHYRRELMGQELKPLASKNFKTRLVSTLRDSLGLALPEGQFNDTPYRVRGMGSVLPCVRFRTLGDDEDSPGLIRFALLNQSFSEPDYSGMEENGTGTVGNGSGTARERQEPSLGTASALGTAKLKKLPIDESQSPPEGKHSHSADKSKFPVPAVPPVPPLGFRHVAAVPDVVPELVAVPDPPVGTPITVDGEPGWSLPGSMPKGDGPTVPVLCVAPNGESHQIERRRIVLSSTTSRRQLRGAA
ncbi:DUF3854 domain-containing protein [Synechococcus sp. CCY9202]|uniref:DUF3854 domain-containing protein n=1 Tax=Synechococcus sp. CCY9202 TaxID=174698 RepID=UPI002B21893A|nr:DUF3854 domain-containing protein [Synechococcus sp. CCY9202]MEA5424278.1 DUF3854 domain-containing protein [Synechococcus sp. CCY9202]